MLAAPSTKLLLTLPPCCLGCQNLSDQLMIMSTRMSGRRAFPGQCSLHPPCSILYVHLVLLCLLSAPSMVRAGHEHLRPMRLRL